MMRTSTSYSGSNKLSDLDEVIEWLVEEGQMTPFAADMIKQEIKKVIEWCLQVMN